MVPGRYDAIAYKIHNFDIVPFTVTMFDTILLGILIDLYTINDCKKIPPVQI